MSDVPPLILFHRHCSCHCFIPTYSSIRKRSGPNSAFYCPIYLPGPLRLSGWKNLPSSGFIADFQWDWSLNFGWTPSGHRLVLKSIQRLLGSKLQAIVILKGELSPALCSRLSLRAALCLAAFILLWILTTVLVSAIEKHQHLMMLPSACFTLGSMARHRVWSSAQKG